MTTHAFAPGFRLSVTDVVILIVGGIAGALLSQVELWLAFVVWYVVGHFFLFCNVLRMARPLELIWAGILVCMVAFRVLLGWGPWPWVLGCSMATTVLLAFVEVRKPSYHGVGWQRVNPRLPEWWLAHGSSVERQGESGESHD